MVCSCTAVRSLLQWCWSNMVCSGDRAIDVGASWQEETTNEILVGVSIQTLQDGLTTKDEK
jgi:hypothetical protein